MRQAVSAAAPGYEKDVPAVVLHDEQNINLSSDGRLVSTQNYAVRLLTKDGRAYAIARAFYLANTSKVKEISAWLIRRDGSVKQYDKKSVLDVIADPDEQPTRCGPEVDLDRLAAAVADRVVDQVVHGRLQMIPMNHDARRRVGGRRQTPALCQHHRLSDIRRFRRCGEQQVAHLVLHVRRLFRQQF